MESSSVAWTSFVPKQQPEIQITGKNRDAHAWVVFVFLLWNRLEWGYLNLFLAICSILMSVSLYYNRLPKVSDLQKSLSLAPFTDEEFA